MRLAWFCVPTAVATRLDDRNALLDALRSTHDIEIFDESAAHDFVWKHFRHPYDLCVYELGNTERDQFIWPYVFHYPGLLWLRTITLHASRAASLERQRRIEHYASEFTFNHACAPPLMGERPRFVGRGEFPMLRAPLIASRMVAVSRPMTAAALADQYPEARIRYVAPGAIETQKTGTPQESGAGERQPVVFGVIGSSRLATIERALARARLSGASAELQVARTIDELTVGCDVVLDLVWPPTPDPPTAALAGMAAGKAVVVFETDDTAEWPSFDPQTWKTRGLYDVHPIVVSVDAGDEEHSVMLAIRRLAEDRALREQLGATGRQWWREHATINHTAGAWSLVLEEARSIEPPARPSGWPPHLVADGTELARTLLAEFDQQGNFLTPDPRSPIPDP
jgi:hypothetical protein